MMKPRGGYLRQLVLPGGGDLILRLRAGARRWVRALAGWYAKDLKHLPDFARHTQMLVEFAVSKEQSACHAWDLLSERDALMTQCEIVFLPEDIAAQREVCTANIFKLLDSHAAQAKRKGLDKINAAADKLARDLQGGAGAAHRTANADNALPPLRVTLAETSKAGSSTFIVDPINVAKTHAEPWQKLWGEDDEAFTEHIGGAFQRLRR